MKKHILILIIILSFFSVPAHALYRVTDFIGGCADCLDYIDGARINLKTKPQYAIVGTTPEHATYPSQDFAYQWDSDAGCAESLPTYVIPDTNAAGGCWVLLTPGKAAIIVANSVNDTHIDWGIGANQVSAVDVPIADGGGLITGTEVETALQENRGLVDTITAAVANHTDTTATGAELETLTDTSDASALHNHTTANLNDTTATGANLNTLTDTSDASGLHNHTTANLNDTTATGSNLNTLTDNSMADTLHRHSELSASDGTPDGNFTVDSDGNASLTGSFTVTGGTILNGDLKVDGQVDVTDVSLSGAALFDLEAIYSGVPFRLLNMRTSFQSATNQSGGSQGQKSFTEVGGNTVNLGGGDYTGNVAGILSEMNIDWRNADVLSADHGNFSSFASGTALVTFGNKTVTIDKLNGMWARGLIGVSSTIGTDTITFDELNGVLIEDSLDDSDADASLTITKNIGVHIEDLSAGVSSSGADYGIVLDDDADGIYLKGTATPTIKIHGDGTNGAITVNAGLDLVGIPTGTTANGALGGGEAVVGAVCMSDSNEIYIDTDGSCAD